MRNRETILPDIDIAIRWSARIIGLILIIILGAVYIKEGRELKLAELRLPEEAMTISFFVALLGLLIGWVWEGLGGMLTIAGLVTFSIIDYRSTGEILLNIWVLGVPAVLFIIYWWRMK